MSLACSPDYDVELLRNLFKTRQGYMANEHPREPERMV